MQNRSQNDKKYISLTFDIEEWFQVESFKELFPIDTWNTQEQRVTIGTEIILEMLNKYNIKATFFVLGWVAERNRELIKKIYDTGHEISSHGYLHQLNYNMNEEELYNDLRTSKELLESIINDEVSGYRAPTFSINDNVLNLLSNLNYKYDSSFNQFSKHDRYGKISNPSKEMVFTPKYNINEVSLPTTTLLNQDVPIAGGGFFRLYPLWLTKLFIKKHFRHHNYYVFYAHPWEFDSKMPKVKGAQITNKFRHYINVDKNYRKLEKYIAYLKELNCNFVTIKEYLDI